jgi:hypothetical protein
VSLDLIKFGMSTTLIQFCGVYYLYDGDKEIENKGFTIGGYELAWLTDLAMAFLLETVSSRNDGPERDR